ncbi:MAG: hypothetical protein H0U54_16195 [Acidobacteria bacterium]|nr:hypothetical protein [Acidobacteriota bacterium]
MLVASFILLATIDTSAQRRGVRIVNKPRVVVNTPRPVVAAAPATNQPAHIIRRRTANGITCYGWDYVKKVYVPRVCPAS